MVQDVTFDEHIHDIAPETGIVNQPTHTLATRVVHGGHSPGTGEPVVTPLVQSVNYVEEVGSAEGLRYPRYGNVPNAEHVQQRLASLEGAEAALFLGSGMGALACGMLALLRPGDHLLASEWIYGGARRLFAEEFPRLGIAVTMVDPTGSREWRRHLRRETRALFLESPSNPACRVIDLGPLRRLAGGEGVGAGRRLHVREPDQLPAAGARRRRRDPQRHEVPERA